MHDARILWLRPSFRSLGVCLLGQWLASNEHSQPADRNSVAPAAAATHGIARYKQPTYGALYLLPTIVAS